MLQPHLAEQTAAPLLADVGKHVVIWRQPIRVEASLLSFIHIGDLSNLSNRRVIIFKKTGLLAAFLYAVNGKIIELAAGCDSSDHIETCNIVLFELALLFVLRYWKKPVASLALLIGMTTGLTFLSK